MESLVEHFNKIRATYLYSFIGQYAISTPKYIELIGENFNLLVGTSFKKDINLPISQIINKYQDHMSDPKSSNEVSIFLDCIFSSHAFNFLSNSKIYSDLSEYKEVKLLNHISSAALNNNIFNLSTSVLQNNVIWRNKKLTIRRNEKICFYSFMKAGDLTILFEDISKILENQT